MTEPRALNAKSKLTQIYAVGLAVFIAIFGFITLLALFLAHLK